MTEKDEFKLRELLKKSPTLTPPETFYKGVLEKIERKSGRMEERAPWYWGYPAKGLATACVLMVIVLVTREAKKNEPELFQKAQSETMQNESRPAPASLMMKKAELAEGSKALSHAGARKDKERFEDLANNKEVQNRVNRNIVKYVDMPSPFEEVDEKAKQDLGLDRKGVASEGAKVRASSVETDESLTSAQSSGKGASADAQLLERRQSLISGRLQARDMNGVASQGSFLDEQKSPALHQKKALQFPSGTLQLKDQLKEEPQAAVALAGSGSVSNAEKADSPLWKGSTSGITTFRTVVVRTSEDWQTLWREHAGPSVPPSPCPPVDFNQYTIIGIFAGTKPTAGYSVDIVDTQPLSDKIVVLYRETTPPQGMITAQVLTQPYHLRLIPKTNLPITFQKVP